MAFIAGLVFIFIRSDSYKASLIVQVIIAGIYAALLISNMIANENTAESVERHEKELQYVKEASSKLKGIMNSINDKKLYKKVEKLYDLFHSSPVKSDNSVRNYELKALELIDNLESNINNESNALSLITEIQAVAAERNRILKQIQR